VFGLKAEVEGLKLKVESTWLWSRAAIALL
jgi:hypothetical protein